MRINSSINPKKTAPIVMPQFVPRKAERKPIKSSLSRKGSMKKSETKSLLSSSFLSLQNYDKKQGTKRLSTTRSKGSLKDKHPKYLSRSRSVSSKKDTHSTNAKKAVRIQDERLIMAEHNSSIKEILEPSYTVANVTSPQLNKTLFNQIISQKSTNRLSSNKRLSS